MFIFLFIYIHFSILNHSLRIYTQDQRSPITISENFVRGSARNHGINNKYFKSHENFQKHPSRVEHYPYATNCLYPYGV